MNLLGVGLRHDAGHVVGVRVSHHQVAGGGREAHADGVGREDVRVEQLAERFVVQTVHAYGGDK